MFSHIISNINGGAIFINDINELVNLLRCTFNNIFTLQFSGGTIYIGSNNKDI
jgi:hypothetical protein